MLARLIGLALGSLLFATASVSTQSHPYTLDTGREIALTGGGIGLLIAAYAVESGQEPFTPEEIDTLDPADINGLDRSAAEHWSPSSATASDVLVWSLLAAPLGLAATEFRDGQPLTLGLMYVETLSLAVGTTQLIKGLANRTRPYVYNQDPSIPENYRLETRARRSFPSGHTSTAFAAAVFLSTTYSKLHPHSPARTWVWVGSLAAAGTVGYLRYRAGEHFPTDLIGGAVIGASAGYLVPRLHQVSPIYVAPSDGGVTFGAQLQF